MEETEKETLTNNGFSLFSIAKYRIGDKEIEMIEKIKMLLIKNT